MRIAILGHQEITTIFLDRLIEDNDINVVLGIFLDPSFVKATDYVDLTEKYKSLKCDFQYISDYSLRTESLEDILIKKKIDFIFVVGWSRLIPENLVKNFNFIGWHGGSFPSPRCRGRAGVNWALINRHNHFFFYTMLLDAGVDSGSILLASELSIESTDTVRTLYIKIGFSLVDIFLESALKILEKRIIPSFNSEIRPTFLPGRKSDDGLVNWLQSDKDVDAFVRALSTPYPNAFSITNSGETILIKRGQPLGKISGLTLKPGEIYAKLAWGGFIVGCAAGNYLVTESSINGAMIDYHGSILKNRELNLNPTINY